MDRKSLLFSLSAFVWIGCGGSQSGNSSQGYFNPSKQNPNGVSSSSVYVQPIFLTEGDSFSKKHFWVQVHRVDLESVQQKFPALVSEKGIWLDFGLSQTGLTQKSLYVGDARADIVPQIVRATLTLGPKFLEQDSQGNIQKHSFALGKGQTQYRVSAVFNSEERKKQNQPLAIDFNLRSLVLHSDHRHSLEPRLSFDSHYFSTDKQIPALLQGEANEVFGSGASLGFLLNQDHQAVKVIADSGTRVFTHLGSTKDVQVKNRTDLQIWGEYQIGKNSFLAQWIRLLPSREVRDTIAMLTGKILSVNKAESTFQVTPFRLQGFVPKKMPVIVHFDKGSLFIGPQGEMITERGLSENSWVHVEGRWDKDKGFQGLWVKLNSQE